MVYLSLFDRPIWDAPSISESILTIPVQYLLSILYRIFNWLHSTSPTPRNQVRVVCISDTHTLTTSIPNGDVLVHAGDLTQRGNVNQIQAQINWLSTLPHKHKIAIAGNHDTYLDARSRATLSDKEQAEELDWKDIRYLQHSGTTLKFATGRQLSIWGAPQVPQCGGKEFAFQYERGLDAWTDTLPDRVDVLITHTPPHAHRDLSYPWLGCPFLLKELWRVKPKLHVFGHVHSGAGRETVYWDETQQLYERAMARKDSGGLFRQLLSARLWLDTIQIVCYGLVGVIWDRVWGGEGRYSILVNAALMVEHVGKLENPVQVVDI